MRRTIPAQIFDVQAFELRSAIPSRADMMGSQDFPAVLIRHDQWETSIGSPFICIFHPPPFPRRRPYWRGMILRYLIGNQFVGGVLRMSSFFAPRTRPHVNFVIF